MSTPILDLNTTAPGVSPGDYSQTLDDLSGTAVAASAPDMTDQIGSYVQDHPALSFATAFVVGVTCAWWLKRA